MIFVTGDVHDPWMGGRDQAWMRRHGLPGELDCAERYAALAETHGIPVTLFLTGRCAEAAPEAVGRLASRPLVDLGGHTWNGLQPVWRHLLRERLAGSYYGSRAAQAEDVRRTLAGLGRASGRPVTLWRTHAFRGDATTLAVLHDAGVRIVSDDVDVDGRIAALPHGLISVPVNTEPDHDGIEHGWLTRDGARRDVLLRKRPWLALRPPWRREDLARAGKEVARRAIGLRPRYPFTDPREPAAWWRRTRRAIDRRLDSNGFATLLLHPACMDIVDRMALLDTIFRELATLPVRPLRDAARLLAGHAG